ncbi:hypothetical protein NMY22_g18763 [Coprinellus aureogranulatus]|nr:hypothetical protein NMY22_g18763 [Coprinellus aureogranulatus]
MSTQDLDQTPPAVDISLFQQFTLPNNFYRDQSSSFPPIQSTQGPPCSCTPQASVSPPQQPHTQQHHTDVCSIAQKNWRAIGAVDSHVANLEQEILIKGEQIKDLRAENDHLWRTIEALGRQLRALQEMLDVSDSE